MIRKLFLVALLGVLASSCLKDKTVALVVDECSGDTISFANEILTEIINPSCNTSGCHDAGTGAAGYTLENYAQISSNANAIIGVIKHTQGTPMPYGGAKLNDSLIVKFECWIQQGLLDN